MAITDKTFLNKTAVTQYPIHNLISERWSPRAFSSRSVGIEKLNSMFEAARWAASAANKQPWRFLVATQDNPEDHARFVETLAEGNVRWAKFAPVLILVVAELYPYPGKEFVSFYDTGMAASNLVTQAVDLGLVTHQMGGFDSDKARTLLNIPDGYVPLAMIAVGYPGSSEGLPDDLRERELTPRTRKAQNEFVFEGIWGQSLGEHAHSS